MIKSKQRKFLKLYEPIHDRFERFCRARTYGEMSYEDLISETLLIAYEKLETLNSQESFLSFLCGISVRLLANNHRKRKAIASPFINENQLHSSDNPEQSAEVHLLHQALTHLSEEQKEAITLYEIAGFTVREIAKIQHVSEGAVKQRLSRGRRKLITILTFESEFKIGEERV